MTTTQTNNEAAPPPYQTDAGEEYSPSGSPDVPTINTSPLRDDEIGVVFDYVPPPATSDYPNNSPESNHNGGSHQSRNTHHHRHHGQRRHRSRHHHRRRQEQHFLRTYAKHWISQCVAALLTGTIFLAIGIALTTIQVATYIGIMFILVSLPSFFMAIHMVRSRMRQRRLRRIHRERRRRRATRRRQRAAENAAFRGTALPYSDLPPAYDNLAFNETEGDFEINRDAENLSISTLSEDSEIPPPIYDDEWDKISLDAKDLEDPEIASTDENKLKHSFMIKNESETEDPSPLQNPHCSYNTE